MTYIPTFPGTYTPTLTNIANIDSTTAYQCQYIRVGNVVTVSGKIDVDPTAGASTLTRVGVSLPVASNFGASEDCGGCITSGTSADAGAILGDSTNDRAEISFTSRGTTSITMYFVFNYEVI